MNYQKEKYGDDARTVNTSSSSTEIYKNKVDATKNQELSNELFVVETNDRLVLFNFFQHQRVCACARVHVIVLHLNRRFALPIDTYYLYIISDTDDQPKKKK